MSQPSPRRLPTADELLGDPLLAAIERLVNACPEGAWFGSAAELLAELNAHAPEAVRSKVDFWPRGPSGLGRRLRSMAEGFRVRGLAVNFRQGSAKSLCIARQTAKAA